jgi:hypothetical protein
VRLRKTISYCPFFLLKEREHRCKFLDSNLIRVAPECHNIGIVVLFAEICTLRNDKGMRKRKER